MRKRVKRIERDYRYYCPGCGMEVEWRGAELFRCMNRECRVQFLEAGECKTMRIGPRR